MSLWDFVGGAADSMLDKRKRDMAAQLQKDLEEQRKNFQMTLEQQRAEREQDRYNMNAESENLNRMREDDRYEKESAAREAERKANEALRRDELAFRKSDSAADRASQAALRQAELDDRKEYRSGLAAQSAEKQESKLVSSLMSDLGSLVNNKEYDEVYKDALAIKNDPELPASEKIKLLDAMLKRKLAK